LLTGCSTDGFVSEHPVANAAPPLKPGVYRIDAVEVKPVATHEVEPDYPIELGSILTGKATVVFTVRADGKTADASVVEADDVLFGEAALKALRKWRFHPAEIKGAPVDCRMSLPFVFTSPYGYGVEEGGGDLPSGDKPPGSHQTTVESH